ncbi:hypothetical protein JW962_03760 [Candidatus Dojkabacteria bacterium]|nr:hypothetical protein [Candidatus Dojkabacteria bacterium]
MEEKQTYKLTFGEIFKIVKIWLFLTIITTVLISLMLVIFKLGVTVSKENIACVGDIVKGNSPADYTSYYELNGFVYPLTSVVNKGEHKFIAGCGEANGLLRSGAFLVLVNVPAWLFVSVIVTFPVAVTLYLIELVTRGTFVEKIIGFLGKVKRFAGSVVRNVLNIKLPVWISLVAVIVIAGGLFIAYSSKVQSRFKDIFGSFLGTSEEVDTLKEQISDLETEVGEKGKSVDDLEETIEELETQLDKLKAGESTKAKICVTGLDNRAKCTGAENILHPYSSSGFDYNDWQTINASDINATFKFPNGEYSTDSPSSTETYYQLMVGTDRQYLISRFSDVTDFDGFINEFVNVNDPNSQTEYSYMVRDGQFIITVINEDSEGTLCISFFFSGSNAYMLAYGYYGDAEPDYTEFLMLLDSFEIVTN